MKDFKTTINLETDNEDVKDFRKFVELTKDTNFKDANRLFEVLESPKGELLNIWNQEVLIVTPLKF